jgi:pyruvate kinase
MRRRRNVKIVATLGPASSTAERVRALFEAGVDVFRLNASHGTPAELEARHRTVREVEAAVGRPVGVLLDLQGPKLRIGTFAAGAVELAAGQRFRLDADPAPGDAGRVALPHPEVYAALAPGVEILLDDGRVRLRVERCGPDFAETVALGSARLADRKGVNLPGALLPLSALSAKDRRDLDLGLRLGVDWVALSFVQRPEDVEELRAIVGGRAGVVSKIEKPAALASLERVVAASDAVMVARGDLGVEMPPEEVPVAQKRIVAACRRRGRPVIVATQMLESMTAAPRPTRAEASDVATAVFDGADAVMLSAESAIGAYPVEAVEMMDRIVHRAEGDPSLGEVLDARQPAPEATIPDAITDAARRVARTVDAALVAAFTNTGSTAIRASRARPTVPILAMTPELATARRLALAWGVHAVHTADARSFDEMISRTGEVARREGLAAPGRAIVVTAGVPFGTPGATNLLHILVAGEDAATPAAAR